jgi:hypothetical protein
MRHRLSVGSLLLAVIAAGTLTGQEKKLYLDPINVAIPHIATDKSIKYDYDIVYVRSLRAGDKVHKRFFTDFSSPVTLEPGADLMLLHPDGKEELLVEGGAGSVTDPMVSFDGQWVYYTHIHHLQKASQWNPPRQGADIYKIHVPTRRIVRLTNQKFSPNTGAADWSKDFRTPEKGKSHIETGVYNMGPCPLPGGRIVFTSNRDGFRPARGYPAVALQLFVMDDRDTNIGDDDTPTNLEKIGHLNISGALHPVVLMDGRIMYSTLESQGIRDSILWGIWTIHPDGTNWNPLVSAFDPGGAPNGFHFQTQLSDSSIVFEEYYNQNNSGFGAFMKMPAPLVSRDAAAERSASASRLNLLDLARIGHELLPPGEARLELVPVGDLGLAEFPAQVDLPAVHPAGEVDQPREVVLQLDAEVFQFLLVFLHPFAVVLQLVLDLLELLLVRRPHRPALGRQHAGQAFVALAQVAGQLGDVLRDLADQRQGGVRLTDGEVLFMADGFVGSHILSPCPDPGTRPARGACYLAVVSRPPGNKGEGCSGDRRKMPAATSRVSARGPPARRLCLMRRIPLAFVPALDAETPQPLCFGHRSRLGHGRLVSRRVGRLGPHRLDRQFRRRHRRRVQRRLPPGDFQGQLGVIDDATVPAVATLVVRGAHEDAVHRARVHAQRAEHALGVVDLEAVDPEALADRVLDLLDVDAVDRAGAGALVAADAGGQVEPVKPAVARLDRDGQLGVLEMLGEGLAAVGLDEVPQGHVHALPHRRDRLRDVAKPLTHGILSATAASTPTP